ncbi:hypothetical protein M8818_005905 [Zalaria obscura]|uniref:Uncharacterized protein n=1 Tax=Zalaria obscura TaxID=2024903 RepID=A0ACC3S870_9PEZI
MSMISRRVVPQNALDCSFLFKALTAFSAGHQCKVHGIDALEAIATAFHTACVRELLQSISQAGTRSYDNELATACLLRSEHRHLLGAYSFADGEPPDFNNRGLLQAGVWNYLREEITMALECRKPVRMGRIFDRYTYDPDAPDDMHANHIIAAKQYLNIARMLLTLFNPSPPTGHISQSDLDLAQRCALDVCGVAWINQNIPATVNGFGPLAFSGGRHLIDSHHRDALCSFLNTSSKLTGWPVQLIINDLNTAWQ